MAINFLNTVQVHTDVLHVDSENDRVGIGTDSPSAKLDVVDASLGAMFRLSNTEANATIKYGAILGRHYTNSEENITGMLITSSSSGTGGSVSIGGGISAANAVNNVIFFTAADNTTLAGSERMRINSSGNVGIGTTSPTAPLHIEGGTNNEVLKIEADVSPFVRWVKSGSDVGFLQFTSTSAYLSNMSNGSFFFRTNNTDKMTITSAGNVGIGTTSPEANLSVVGETSTNDLIGGSINLATSYGWTIPSGTFTQRVGYYGGDFTLNGLAAENSMELGLGPFNDRQMLWTTIGSIDSDGDGGWNKTLTNLDINSSYLSVVYFRRTSSETAGTFYHGTGNNILNLNGTANTNPYFTVRALSGFDQNVWYASVGVIQSNSDSNTVVSPLAGIYRLDTGAKINGGNGYKFDTDGATLSRGHRAYLFYSADVDVVGQFTSPGFYKIDGDQPKLHDILGGDNDDVFWSASGDNIYNDNSGDVGIGLTNPDTKLTIENASGGPASTTYATTASKANLHLSAVGVPFYNHLFMGIGSATYAWIQAQHGNSAAQNLVLNPIGGNVGIGTTSPSVALDVSGEIAIRGGEAADDARMYFRASDNSNRFTIETDFDGSTSNDLLGFRAVGVDNVLVLKGNGNVGIGTATPSAKLHVDGGVLVESGDDKLFSIDTSSGAFKLGDIDGLNDSAYIEGDGSVVKLMNDGTATLTSTVDNYIGIGTTSPGSKLEVNGEIDATGSNGYLINGMGFAIESSGVLSLGDWDGNDFQTRIMDQNGVEVLRVNDEKVGIGTATPVSTLEVNGEIDVNGGDGYLINGMGFAIENSGVLTLGDWDGNGFATRIYDENTNEVLRVAGGGVGIGVTNPVSKLQVYRSDSNFASTLAHMGTRSSLILRSSSTDNAQFFVAQGASGSTILQTANDVLTTPRNLNFNPFGGNVSVGLETANPTEKLVVVGNVVATNFVLSSDKRLKENIEKVCDNRVKADWKTFELKTEKGEKRYGVIAQELEENHPEFIKTDNEGFKSVKYIDLLIAKIAELEARLEKAGI